MKRPQARTITPEPSLRIRAVDMTCGDQGACDGVCWVRDTDSRMDFHYFFAALQQGKVLQRSDRVCLDACIIPKYGVSLGTFGAFNIQGISISAQSKGMPATLPRDISKFSPKIDGLQTCREAPARFVLISDLSVLVANVSYESPICTPNSFSHEHPRSIRPNPDPLLLPRLSADVSGVFILRYWIIKSLLPQPRRSNCNCANISIPRCTQTPAAPSRILFPSTQTSHRTKATKIPETR